MCSQININMSENGEESWKSRARKAFEEWLSELPDEQLPQEDSEKTDTVPDLFSFYKELCALKSEVRTMGRRTHESLGRFKETLDVVSSSVQVDKQESFIKYENIHAPLAEFHRRFKRIADRFNTTPSGLGIFGSDKKWRDAWNAQKDAFRLVNLHIDTLFAITGMKKIDVIGKQFDPSYMNALETGTRPGILDNTIIEEIAPGYTVDDKIIRYAEVKVNKVRSE